MILLFEIRQSSLENLWSHRYVLYLPVSDFTCMSGFLRSVINVVKCVTNYPCDIRVTIGQPFCGIVRYPLRRFAERALRYLLKRAARGTS